MRENSPLGRLAFWVATALAVLWAVGGIGGLLFGLIEQPSVFWPALIALAPVTLIIIAVVVDRLRSAEDTHYSRDVHD